MSLAHVHLLEAADLCVCVCAGVCVCLCVTTFLVLFALYNLLSC